VDDDRSRIGTRSEKPACGPFAALRAPQLVVIADAAYSAQSKPGIETILADGD